MERKQNQQKASKEKPQRNNSLPLLEKKLTAAINLQAPNLNQKIQSSSIQITRPPG